MRNTTSPRRALVLVGPPKTGSSHVQAFLVANRDHLEKHGWTLPPAVDGRPADDKSFANLAGALANRSCSPHQWLGAPTLTDAILSLCHGRDAERRLFERRHEEVLHRFEQSFARIALSAAPNLVVSAEDLALFDGADARSVEARRTLRRLLQPFAEATVLIVYRTPRAPAVQSLFTEDLDWGYDGVREGAHGGMAAWLYRRLHNASLLTTAPWSSSTRVARLADAYASSGFAIQIISSTGAARDGLDTTDVLACEVLGVPCTDGKAAWSAYRRARTDETGYDGLASSVALTLPKLLRSAGCSSLARPGGGARHGDDDEDGGGAGALELLDGGGSGVSKAAAKRRVQLAAALVPELLHDGAATQCSDLHGLELLLRRYEADGLRRYRSRVLHWHAADFEAAADGGDAAGAGGGEADEFARRRTLCELDLASEATWAALRRLAARRGLSCGAAQHEGVYWLPAWALVCVLALLCCGRSRQGRDQRGRHGGRAGRHEDGDDDWASDDDCRDECAYGLELQCGLRAETLLRLLLALSVALLLGLQRADLWPAGAAPPTPVARPTQPQRSAGGGARAGGGGAQELPRGGAYYRVLCGPRCGFLPVSVLTAAAAPDVTSVPLQSEERARNVSRSARWPPTCVEDAGEAKTAPRTLYTILTNPLLGERCCYSDDSTPRGRVPAASPLKLHLAALAALPSRLAALMVLLPYPERSYDGARPAAAGYLDVAAEATRLPFPASLELLPNNSLGSYGMYLHAYAATRGQYEWYVFAEDDYVPLLPHFDARLIRMHTATFGPTTAGCLAGLLQGRPVEAHSRFELHLESSHVMPAASLAAVYAHLYGRLGWRGSTADRMLRLAGKATYFGKIQLGFGKLLLEAGVEMRDWSAAYRVPYWNHHSLVDWSGPMLGYDVLPSRVLFAPTQWLVHDEVKMCCQGSDCDESVLRVGVCRVSKTADDPDACCKTRAPPPAALTALRRRWSVAPDALDVRERRNRSRAPRVRQIGPQAAQRSNKIQDDVREVNIRTAWQILPTHDRSGHGSSVL